MKTILCFWTYHIVLFAIDESLIPELLYGNEYADPIADLFYSYLLKDFLIALKQVIPIEIVRCPPC